MHLFNTVFKFRLASGQLAAVKRKASLFYEATYEKLFEKMCEGRLLHVDETRANVHGVNAYVWVFTSLEEVIRDSPDDSQTNANICAFPALLQD